MKVQIIRTTGAHEEHDVPFSAIPDLLKCGVMDSVNLGDGRVMLVDDNGYEVLQVEIDENTVELMPVRAKKPLNQEATRLYHTRAPDTEHQIVGDVAIVPESALV